jgi:hypothetical protein
VTTDAAGAPSALHAVSYRRLEDALLCARVLACCDALASTHLGRYGVATTRVALTERRW